MLKVRSRKGLICTIIVCVSIAVLLPIVSVIVAGIGIISYSQVNIFSNISECYSLDNLKVVDEPLTDQYIEDIPYMNSYVYELNYDSKSFKIYAYQFEDIDDAKEYYSTVVGGKKSDREYDCYASSNMFSSGVVVRNGNNAYRLEAGWVFDYIDIMRYLNSIFTVQIME